MPERKPPQSPFLPLWIGSSALLATGFLLALMLGGLPPGGAPWSAGPLAELAPLAVPLAIGAGSGLSFAPLLLLRWRKRRFHATPGRVLATLFLLLTLPSALIGSYIPVSHAVVGLMVILRTPDAGLILKTLAGLIAVAAVLYPLACAVLMKVPQPWRLPGLMLLPFGAWCFLLIAGGTI